MDVILDKILTP